MLQWLGRVFLGSSSCASTYWCLLKLSYTTLQLFHRCLSSVQVTKAHPSRLACKSRQEGVADGHQLDMTPPPPHPRRPLPRPYEASVGLIATVCFALTRDRILCHLWRTSLTVEDLSVCVQGCVCVVVPPGEGVPKLKGATKKKILLLNDIVPDISTLLYPFYLPWTSSMFFLVLFLPSTPPFS